MGTLGAGNHYAEIQVVDEIFDAFAAKKMGIDKIGQVVIMIHSGSRGLGHQVATDACEMEKAMAKDGLELNDRQLACARISSQEGKDYLAAMACAANYAWVNRQSMTFLCRQALKNLQENRQQLDMNCRLRRLPQHCQNRRARRRRRVKNLTRSPKRIHPCVPSAPPTHPS